MPSTINKMEIRSELSIDARDARSRVKAQEERRPGTDLTYNFYLGGARYLQELSGSSLHAEALPTDGRVTLS